MGPRAAATGAKGGVAGPVLLLDDDADLRCVVSDFVEVLCGNRCLAVGSFEEMVAAAAEVLRCSVALLDVNLGAGKPSGIDAYRWLVSQGFGGRLYFFTGHAHLHPLLMEIQKLGGVEVLAKPVDADKLMEVLACRTMQASSC